MRLENGILDLGDLGCVVMKHVTGIRIKMPKIKYHWKPLHRYVVIYSVGSKMALYCKNTTVATDMYQQLKEILNEFTIDNNITTYTIKVPRNDNTQNRIEKWASNLVEKITEECEPFTEAQLAEIDGLIKSGEIKPL